MVKPFNHNIFHHFGRLKSHFPCQIHPKFPWNPHFLMVKTPWNHHETTGDRPPEAPRTSRRTKKSRPLEGAPSTKRLPGVSGYENIIWTFMMCIYIYIHTDIIYIYICNIQHTYIYIILYIYILPDLIIHNTYVHTCIHINMQMDIHMYI